MKYFITYSVIITLLCFFSVKSCVGYKADNQRLSNNQTALTKEIEIYKTNDGKNAARIIQLELTNGEYEKLMSEQANKIKQLGIKIKRLESVNSTASETTAGGKVPIKDSVRYIYKDSIRIIDSVRYFEWNDTWSKINGIITPDSVECYYHGIDTLDIICHRVPKKFLGFIPCGTKYIQTEIVNANQNTTIVYSKSIKLTKKRKK